MRPPQDPQAGPVDRALLPLHEEPERVTVTGEDRLHDCPVVHTGIVPCDACHALRVTVDDASAVAASVPTVSPIAAVLAR